jgi:HEAT repeat protein
MRRIARLALLVPMVLSVAVTASAQPSAKFEDVVRNLRNPDPKIRISALRLLREAGYAEAIVPISALLTDPINEIQLEAIDAELAFYLVEPVPTKRRVAFVLEKRASGGAVAAFDAGPLAAWPKPSPAELVDGLLTAVDDEHRRVRVEAIYALGVVGRAPLAEAATGRLIKALDHYDAAVREGAAKVIGRLQVKSAGDALLKAVNDSNAQVRYASIRALGEIRQESAVQALTEQLNYYGKGEGAAAAIDALARIAHPSSLEVFKARITDKDPYVRRAAAEGLGRTGDASSIASFDTASNMDDSEMVRAAMTYAIHKKGSPNALSRLIDFLDSNVVARQIQDYLVELGPPAVKPVTPRLQEPDEVVRRNLVIVLGAIGDQSTVAALTPLKGDRDRDVAAAATHAIERIKMTQK